MSQTSNTHPTPYFHEKFVGVRLGNRLISLAPLSPAAADPQNKTHCNQKVTKGLAAGPHGSKPRLPTGNPKPNCQSTVPNFCHLRFATLPRPTTRLPKHRLSSLTVSGLFRPGCLSSANLRFVGSPFGISNVVIIEMMI